MNKQQHYELIFKVTEEFWLPLYIDLCLRAGYKETNFLFLYKNPRLEVYLSQEDQRKPSLIGFNLYKDKKKTNELIKKGKKVSEKIDIFLKKNDPKKFNNVSNEEIEKILKETCFHYIKLIEVYKYTESFYFKKINKFIEDYVFDNIKNKKEAINAFSVMLDPSVKNGIIKGRERILDSLGASEKIIILCESIRVIGKEKLFFRKTVNNLSEFFQLLMENIAERLDLSFKQTESCLYDEIISLFREKKRKFIINRCDRRSELFAVKKERGKWVFITGLKAEKLISSVEPKVAGNISEFKGIIASVGSAKGKVRIMPVGVGRENIVELKKKMSNFRKGDILVAKSAGPEMIIACRKAGAIVAEEGGISSHAAIISREFNIPCLVNTKIATDILKDGDLIEVEANNNGIVRIINKANK